MDKKKIVGIFIVAIGIIIAVFLCVRSLIRYNAEKTGTACGKSMGTIVGKAIGTFEGITKGREEGWQAGKEAGLSAEDTTVKIANTIREAAVLEVLVASVKLSDIHSVGDDYKGFVK